MVAARLAWALGGFAAVALAAFAAGHFLLEQTVPDGPATLERSAAGAALSHASLAGLLAWPVLMMLGVIHLLTRRLPGMIVALELHLALYLTCLVFQIVAFRLDGIEFLVNLAAIAAQLGVIAAGRHRSLRSMPWLAMGLGAGAILGLVGAIQAWSSAMPARIQAAAERHSGGQPYCIVTAALRRATRAQDLRGLALFQRAGAFRAPHALLAIGPREARRYALWSFARGDFVPLAEAARASLSIGVGPGLDSVDACALPPVGAAAAHHLYRA